MRIEKLGVREPAAAPWREPAAAESYETDLREKYK